LRGVGVGGKARPPTRGAARRARGPPAAPCAAAAHVAVGGDFGDAQPDGGELALQGVEKGAAAAALLLRAGARRRGGGWVGSRADLRPPGRQRPPRRHPRAPPVRDPGPAPAPSSWPPRRPHCCCLQPPARRPSSRAACWAPRSSGPCSASGGRRRAPRPPRPPLRPAPPPIGRRRSPAGALAPLTAWSRPSTAPRRLYSEQRPRRVEIWGAGTRPQRDANRAGSNCVLVSSRWRPFAPPPPAAAPLPARPLARARREDVAAAAALLPRARGREVGGLQ
jgi:hypothetical protein